jgi:hypothetical protein
MASIPAAKLKALLTSSSDLSKASLGTRIMLTRMRLEVQNDPASVDSKVVELEQTISTKPQLADDLATI